MQVLGTKYLFMAVPMYNQSTKVTINYNNPILYF